MTGKTIAEDLLEHEGRGPDYLTYVARPKFVERIQSRSDLSPDGGEKTAILLHGPMIYADHFTRDTVRLYRQHYPNALIILSTWEKEDLDYLTDMQETAVRQVLSPQPSGIGERKSERYRVPVHAGILEAATHDVSHLLVTQTDQRLYAPNVIDLLRTLQRCFPLKKHKNQRDRIIASAYGTRKYIPLCVNVMVMFGHIDDLSRYWSGDSSPRSETHGATNDRSVETFMLNNPWHHLTTAYLRQSGISFDTSQLEDSWRIMAELFCLVDKGMLDLYWHQESSSSNYSIEHLGNWYSPIMGQFMTFRDWLLMNQYPERIYSAPTFDATATIHDSVVGAS